MVRLGSRAIDGSPEIALGSSGRAATRILWIALPPWRHLRPLVQRSRSHFLCTCSRGLGMHRFHAHAPSTAPRPDGSARDLVLPSVVPGHGVQFYEDEDFLAAAVSDFLAAGLTLGQPSVVIATEAHRQAFLRHLSNEGFDVDDASRSGQLTFLDARETLSAFMVDDKPNGDRFRNTVGPVVDRAARRTNGRFIRLYGEMVDLLWKDGNTDGAIELEELWN